MYTHDCMQTFMCAHKILFSFWQLTTNSFIRSPQSQAFFREVIGQTREHMFEVKRFQAGHKLGDIRCVVEYRNDDFWLFRVPNAECRLAKPRAVHVNLRLHVVPPRAVLQEVVFAFDQLNITRLLIVDVLVAGFARIGTLDFQQLNVVQDAIRAASQPWFPLTHDKATVTHCMPLVSQTFHSIFLVNFSPFCGGIPPEFGVQMSLKKVLGVSWFFDGHTLGSAGCDAHSSCVVPHPAPIIALFAALQIQLTNALFVNINKAWIKVHTILTFFSVDCLMRWSIVLWQVSGRCWSGGLRS